MAICALFVGGGNLMAQKDVTSLYITNATLADGTNGWTKTFSKNKSTNDPADAFSNSVRGENTVGYASEAYAGWGELIQTAYSMKQTITLPAGNYRLVCYAFFRQGQAYNTNSGKSLAKLVAGEKEVALKTLGSITAAGYANNQKEGANCFDSKMYRNVVEFNIAADNTNIEIGVEGTFDEMRSWCIVGQFELFDLDDLASVSSPTDVTYAITNPGFEYRDLTGWTTETSDDKAFWYMDNSALSGKAGIGWVESYQGGGIPNGRVIKQQLTGLDNGLYEVTVYGHLQQGSGSDGFYLYANSDRVAIGSTDQDYSVTTNVTDGNLTIKLATDGCNGNWAAFDKVRLQFYGDPLAAYQDILDAKVATAQALVNGNTIPDAAETALQTVINDNDNDGGTFTTEAEFTTAISNIETAYNTYKALEIPYSAWQEVKSLADDVAALVYVETVSGSHSTFADAISTQNTAAEASTAADGLNTASTNLKSAIKTYMSGATLTFVGELDFTCMIENPSFETGNFTGWTNTGMALQDNASFVKSGTYYAEKWQPDGTFGVEQTISNLPAGAYSLSAHAKARFVESAKVYAGSQESTITIADSEKDYDVKFVSTGSDITIGYTGTGDGTTNSWLCIDNFTMKYLGYAATTSEKTALSDAITAAEANTLGFETGEYAPYNNVAAVTALAAAKAINPETAASSAVVSATTALTGATWTANVDEVNAVYNGTFAATPNDGAPAGWTMSNNTLGGSYHSRAFVGDSRLSEFNGTNSGLFLRFDGTNSDRGSQYTYGNTTGYTMPLKAGTTYRVTVDFTNWGTTDEKPLTLNVDGPNSFNASQTKSSTKNADSGSDTPDQFEIIFTTIEAGNYSLRFQVQGSDDNKHNVIVSNIVLKKAVFVIDEDVDYTPIAGYADVTLTRTLSNTNWNTFVVPFDIDNATLTAKFGTVEVAEYAEASADAQNATVSFTKMATPAITANTPVLLKTSTAPASVTFNGVQVKTGEAKVAGTNFDFVGSYDAKKYVKTGDYYIYQNKIYKSAKDNGTFINGTRAYIEAKTTGARIVDFTIDGVTSGIRDLNADLSESEGVVYNLNGQKVQNMKNGVFVKNGKKVVVK